MNDWSFHSVYNVVLIAMEQRAVNIDAVFIQNFGSVIAVQRLFHVHFNKGRHFEVLYKYAVQFLYRVTFYGKMDPY